MATPQVLQDALDKFLAAKSAADGTLLADQAAAANVAQANAAKTSSAADLAAATTNLTNAKTQLEAVIEALAVPGAVPPAMGVASRKPSHPLGTGEQSKP